MEVIAYAARCLMMLLVTWAGLRMIGKKSIAEMTSYDLAAIMILTTVAAEPLVYKITSKATLGVTVITGATILVGYLSLKKPFYNLDSSPMAVISNGKIIKQNLSKARMNIPLLMSELRVQGYQNIADVRFAIIEPSGKLSVIPKAEASPPQAKDLGVTTGPKQLSIPLIIDGHFNDKNWSYLDRDKSWLKEQLQAFGVERIEDVLLAQLDSQGQLQVYPQIEEKIEIPNLF